MHKQIIILGVPIDDLNMEQALDRLEEFIEIGRKEGKTHHVATVNADFAVKARNDPELRQILLEIDMATADGMPLVWGARLLGMHLEGRVTGADLVPALAERAAKKEYTLYFLGAAPGVAAQAAEILKARYPGLKIVGVVSPPKSSILQMDPAIVEDIRRTKPDVLLVAFGNPKQEKWISLYRRELSVPVMIGVGGTFDFIAGNTKRAPEWMQRTGLEWVFRLIQEPGRLWKRYVTDMRVFTKVFVQQWWLMRKGQGQAAANQSNTDMPSDILTIVEDSVVTNVKTSSSFSGENVKHTTIVGAEVPAPREINANASHIIPSTAPVGTATLEVAISTPQGSLAPKAQSNQGFPETLSVGAAPDSQIVPMMRQPSVAEDKLLSDSKQVGHSEVALSNANYNAEDSKVELTSGIQEAKPAPQIESQPEIESETESQSESESESLSNTEPVEKPKAESRQISHSTTVLHLKGRLDISNVTAFTEKGQKALLKTPNLIINLAQVEFLDSRALGAIVGLTKQARQAGGELWLAEVPPTIYRVLSLLRLDRFFKIAPDVDTIIETVAEKPELEPATANFGNWGIIRIPDRLDGNTVQQIVDQGLKQLSLTPRLVLDFSQTSFLASAGLACMLKLNRQSQSVGGEMRLAACSDDVLRTIQMARFDKVLPLYPDVQAACR